MCSQHQDFWPVFDRSSRRASNSSLWQFVTQRGHWVGPFLFSFFLKFILKRFLYFYTVFSKPNCLQKDTGVNFCYRALFQLTGYLSDKCHEKRADGYDVPQATSISDD